jgi:HEAT repeat protein
MIQLAKLTAAVMITLLAVIAFAQSEPLNDAEELKIVALEALISAPPERAMPLLRKVLAGKSSDDVKERALFILGQIDSAEAQSMLLQLASEGSGEPKLEAIRAIGIGGRSESLAKLAAVYRAGDSNTRAAVLEAYLIAGDRKAVFDIAVAADNERDFAEAVDMLGAMGAREELRELRSRSGTSESLIEAYAVSGDLETLREIAQDGRDIKVQMQAIESMGIVDGDRANSALVDIYGTATSDEIRRAALEGMLISGYDTGVLTLYRSAENAGEKRELLEYLVMMNSDAVWEVIDSALDDQP